MRYMNTGVISDAVFKFDCPAGVLVACRYYRSVLCVQACQSQAVQYVSNMLFW